MIDKDKEAFSEYVKANKSIYFGLPEWEVDTDRTIWEAACNYMRNRSPLDPVSLYDKLEKERERSEILVEAVKKCNDDHWFMINLIERYSSDKERALKDCLERMKFRKPLYEKTLEKYRGEL
jgi:hypothetical protein